MELSAVSAGVKDVRAAVDAARRRGHDRRPDGAVHRRGAPVLQDPAGRPAARGGEPLGVFIGATTENPFFSVVSPLLSRSLLLTLQPLSDDDVGRWCAARWPSPSRGLGGAVAVDEEAADHLVRLAGGDARRALTYLEAAAARPGRGREPTSIPADVERAWTGPRVRYDRDGDQHYDVISAFIKSMRGCDVDAALHYLARMIAAGEDPRFIARRLIVHASEDVGMADPTALQTAVAAAQAVELVGLPEARINLAQAVIHISTGAQVQRGVRPSARAAADVRTAGRRGAGAPARRALPGAGKLGHGEGYLYPHDFAGGTVPQRYAARGGRTQVLPAVAATARKLASPNAPSASAPPG